ncbi:hypothetical protein D4764_17G0002480 [Takifugu flavidus]|uniref:ADP-ribosyl cyclase/cyclic ADP-ribose hydrolase n=1 Tax=Takifugu flavidus TaxID=433684 RepID=A0A5C6NV21_9TELE|nr:hypothetical protein D4764_17G0002480 [Takifugu flavidus]
MQVRTGPPIFVLTLALRPAEAVRKYYNMYDTPCEAYKHLHFAEAACGDATVMLNGSIATPFDNSSVFGETEVQKLKLDSTNVTKLTVVLVTATTPVSNCSNESLDELRQELNSKIIYECKEVSETRINECASNNDISCTNCW